MSAQFCELRETGSTVIFRILREEEIRISDFMWVLSSSQNVKLN